MKDKTISVGVMSLFRTKIIRFISINLFFQWFVCSLLSKIVQRSFCRLAQNLVYYGVSQNTGEDLFKFCFCK